MFNLLFFIYALAYLPYLIITRRWFKGYGMRFGIFTPEIKERLAQNAEHIWIHAVSVGEVIAVSSLINQLKVRYGRYPMVLTVTTKTGYELAKSRLASQAIVIPSPLDFSWVVRHFIQRIKPKLYIVAETEIWPNLYALLYLKKIPISIINGRISDRSFERYRMIKSFLAATLGKVSAFCMQSALDQQRIIELGAPGDKVSNIGNLKFDDQNMKDQTSLIFSSKGLLWVAGSTHPGEEEIILKIYKDYQTSCVLVIVPRHIERSASICTLVESLGMKAVLFSKWSTKVPHGTIVVVDSIGLLRQFYNRADFVFVGKSLCVGGGHNIIEPAMYGKPIIIGPMMENFRDITALFNTHQAILQVNSDIELKRDVKRLLEDEHLRKELGQKAQAVVQQNQGALERTLQVIDQWL